MAWLGVAVVAVVAACSLPFALAGVGTAWVRITNLAILFVLLALGPQHRRRLRRAARPGLHRVLRGRRLRLRAARVAALQPPPAVLGDPADRRGGRLLVRRAARRADAEAARRLPGDRDARLRRDHPHLPEQSVAAGQHHQRAAGHHADRPVPHRRLRLRAATRRSSPASRSPGPIKYYYFLLAVLLVVIVINLRLQNSRIGRAWEAIREDEVAARAMGINTRNMKLLAFAMGASFGGIAGRHVLARSRASSAPRASSWSSRSWCSRWSCWAAWAISGA